MFHYLCFAPSVCGWSFACPLGHPPAILAVPQGSTHQHRHPAARGQPLHFGAKAQSPGAPAGDALHSARPCPTALPGASLRRRKNGRGDADDARRGGAPAGA